MRDSTVLDWIDPQHGHGTGGIVFDPSTWSIVHDTRYPASQNGIDWEEFNRRTLHELVHWLQYAGTTWGIFASICNLGQSQRVAKWIDSVSEATRDLILTSHESGVPVLGIGTRRELVAKIPEACHEAEGILGEFVVLYYGSQIMRDSQSLRSSGIEGKLLSDTLEVCSRFPWRDAQLTYEPRGDWEQLGDNLDFGQLDVGCSTVDLLESLAVASEFLSVGHSYDGDFQTEEFEASARRAARRLLGIDVEQYSTCFRIWVGKHPELRPLGDEDPSMENLHKAVFTFGLLADAALNPPLPPQYDMGDPRKVLWKDIYPPARFSLLVDAAADQELIGEEATDDDAKRWILDALEKAQLPGLHRDINQLPRLNDAFDYDFPDDFCYTEATLLPRFKRLINLRHTQFLPVALPGEVVNRSAGYLSPEAEEAVRNSFWLPFYFDDQYEIRTFMPSEACARYCESVFVRRCIRFAPLMTLEDMNSRNHHRRLAEHRPGEETHGELSIRNLGKQYGVWSS